MGRDGKLKCSQFYDWCEKFREKHGVPVWQLDAMWIDSFNDRKFFLFSERFQRYAILLGHHVLDAGFVHGELLCP